MYILYSAVFFYLFTLVNQKNFEIQDVYSPILLNLYFVIPLSLSKILTIYLSQRIYEVGWPLLFFILVALFPHLNIANPSSLLRFPMTTNLFTFPKL